MHSVHEHAVSSSMQAYTNTQSAHLKLTKKACWWHRSECVYVSAPGVLQYVDHCFVPL